MTPLDAPQHEATEGWNAMDIASGLVFRTGHPLARFALLLVVTIVVLLAVLSLLLAGGAWIADLLRPASEPILAAPLRWR